MTTCPRCERDKTRLEYEGSETGRTLWRVYHCLACAFTWRDTEPAASIDAKMRDRWFQVDPDDDGGFSYNIPPAL